MTTKTTHGTTPAEMDAASTAATYRAVYQHSGRDAGLVPHTDASTADECRRRARSQTQGRGTYIIRRYRANA